VRIAYLDCIGGISGDMFVGALLDAGWSEAAFRGCVAWLGDEIRELRIETRQHMALTGKGIWVVSAHDTHSHSHPHPPHDTHSHSHPHSHPAGHSHSSSHPHGHPPAQQPTHDHGHTRGLREVMSRIEQGGLDRAVRARVEQVFTRLAEAEGHAHGVAPEKVHFHEVGAVDAMVDVVAACQGLHDLGIERLYVSTIPVGQGTIEAAHGVIPLPAPATVHLLRNAKVRWMGSGERTTPTGAALVTTLGRQACPPPMRILAVGSGAGSRSLPDVPNLARLIVGESEEDAGSQQFDLLPSRGSVPGWGWERSSSEEAATWRAVIELTTQIDDASAEELAVCVDLIREAGARDVFLTPIGMKRGRPGTLLTAIVLPASEERLTRLILEQSPSLGVRRSVLWRRELPRRIVEVATEFGPVAVKFARKGRRWAGKPESEACRRLASRLGVSYQEVWQAALLAAGKLAGAATPPAWPAPDGPGAPDETE